MSGPEPRNPNRTTAPRDKGQSVRNVSFEDALARAKAERTPRMALRPDGQFPDELDDIVVEDVKMFRAEAMDDDVWWMACYFHNGEQITFHVGIEKKPRRIVMKVTDEPKEWVDLDG